MKQFDRTREKLTDPYYQKGNFNTPFSETDKADMEEYMILNSTIMKFELIHKHIHIKSWAPKIQDTHYFQSHLKDLQNWNTSQVSKQVSNSK